MGHALFRVIAHVTARCIPRSTGGTIGFAGALSVITFMAVSSSSAIAQTAQSPFFQPLRDTVSIIPYATYTPGECLAAVTRTGLVAQRTSGFRTEGWEGRFLEHDTVLTVQRQTASACATHLIIESVAARDLPDLARLYWFAGDTTAISRTIARRRSLDLTDSARAVTARQLVTRFLLGSQRDVAFATRVLLPTLDSLSSLGAQKARFQTHVALAYTFASSRLPDAGDASRAQVDEAIREFEHMPAIVQATLVDTIGPLFKLGAAAATETGDTIRARTLLDAARKLLPQLPDGARHVHAAEAIVRYFGMAAPRLRSDFVFGVPAGVTPSSPWPRSGRWTLIAPMPWSGRTRDFYKNLATTFGDTLDIVFFFATRGHWRPRGPLEPKDEATLAYDYLSRRWGVPGVLLVEEREFRTLPDGRRIAEATRTPDIYQGNGLVIDPQGTIRAMIDPATLVRFDLILRSLMSKTVAEHTP